jgi:hypothetical protein
LRAEHERHAADVAAVTRLEEAVEGLDRLGLCMPGFRISAHSAGVSVSAVIADSSVES